MTVLIQVQLLPNQTTAIQLPPEAAGHGRRLEALYLFVQRAAQWLHPSHPEARFYLQLLDEEPDAPCFRFDGSLAAPGPNHQSTRLPISAMLLPPRVMLAWAAIFPAPKGQ